VALFTEFFRFLFIHCHKFGVISIVGQMLGRFLGRIPEKEKQSAADY
jgi:hypothetical protein